MVRVNSYIEDTELLNLILEQIEEEESTHLILEITKWLLSEVDAYGEDCEDSNMKEVMFRYKLDGLGEKWGTLTNENVKNYEYLSPGNYTFNAEVMSNEGKIIGNLQYRFTVKPPFYWSNLFKFFYLLIIIALLYAIYIYIKKKYALKML